MQPRLRWLLSSCDGEHNGESYECSTFPESMKIEQVPWMPQILLVIELYQFSIASEFTNC